MARRQPDMFPETIPKRKPIKRAHVCDAGEGQPGFPYGASFQCERCGWQSDWTCFDNATEIRKGLPCPKCNEVPE